MSDNPRQLESKLKSAMLHMGSPEHITKLAGDASTRAYYRARFPDSRSVILMVSENPALHEEEAFLEVQHFLETLGLAVPGVLAHIADDGIIVLEDLGDDLLEVVVRNAPAERIRDLYYEATDILLRMRRATFTASKDCRPFHLAFDQQKLMQEMSFFVRHYIGSLRKARPSAAATSALERFFVKICEMLAAEPRIFTHRDYHSRNLMLHGGRLFMIDFQDARMGPAQYDLASLLRDSYVTLPEDLVDELLDYYAQETGKTGEVARDRFRYIFDVMSLQRNIKALGTFGYQIAVRGSTRYESSIPRTGRYIERNIARHEEFGEFRAVVEEFIWGPALEKKDFI